MMSEITLDDQPHANGQPDAKSPSGNQPQDQAFDDVMAQANRQKISEMMKNKGLSEDDLNAIRLDHESKIINEFSEVDGRVYKSIDGIKKTFDSRRNTHREFEAFKENHSAKEAEEGSEKITKSKADQKPTDEKSGAEMPEGAMSVDDYNRLAIRQLLSESSELEFVKNDVEEYARDEGKSLLDLFQKDQNGKFVNSRAAQLFEIAEARSIKSEQAKKAEMTKKSMPSMGSAGQGQTSSGKRMTLEEFNRNKGRMSPEEQIRALDGGMVG